jgi:hypothetical protein
MGLISAHHELGQDAQAIADVQKIPRPPTKTRSPIPAFSPMLGAIYQQANQLTSPRECSSAQMKLEIAAGGHPCIALAVAVGRHLSAAQQHRSGLRHLPPGAR